MVCESVAAGFPSFASGLAFLALAGIAHAASRRSPARRGWFWLVLAAAAYGLSQWAGTCGLQLGQPQACRLVRLAFWAASLAALIEFAQHAVYGRRPGLLGRWTWLPCIALAAISATGGGLDWLESTCQLALVWQCLAIGGLLVRRGMAPARPAPELAIGAASLAIFAAATALRIPVLEALSALAAVASSWLADRNERPIADRCSRLRECRWPVAFAALMCMGWFALSAKPADSPAQLAALSADGAGATRPEATEFGRQAAPAVVRQPAAKRSSYGLAGGLVVSVVVIIGLLSRLPAFRQDRTGRGTKSRARARAV